MRLGTRALSRGAARGLVPIRRVDTVDDRRARVRRTRGGRRARRIGASGRTDGSIAEARTAARASRSRCARTAADAGAAATRRAAAAAHAAGASRISGRAARRFVAVRTVDAVNEDGIGVRGARVGRRARRIRSAWRSSGACAEACTARARRAVPGLPAASRRRQHISPRRFWRETSTGRDVHL